LAYLKLRWPENAFFGFISVRYTTTDLQTAEILWYITRSAKWSIAKNLISGPQNSKNEHQLKHKNQVRN